MNVQLQEYVAQILYFSRFVLMTIREKLWSG